MQPGGSGTPPLAAAPPHPPRLSIDSHISHISSRARARPCFLSQHTPARRAAASTSRRCAGPAPRGGPRPRGAAAAAAAAARGRAEAHRLGQPAAVPRHRHPPRGRVPHLAAGRCRPRRRPSTHTAAACGRRRIASTRGRQELRPERRGSRRGPLTTRTTARRRRRRRRRRTTATAAAATAARPIARVEGRRDGRAAHRGRRSLPAAAAWHVPLRLLQRL